MRWFAPAIVIGGWLVVVAITFVLDGAWLAAAAVFMLGGLYVLQREHARQMYRRGWRTGFAEGSVGGAEVTRGRIPAFVLRAQTRSGDPVPEPWDGVDAPHVEAVVLRRPPADDDGA